MSDLSGINLAMQTPMSIEGQIDFDRFETLIEQYVESGMHGIVLGAGTGQHPYLTESECNTLFELGARCIDGRCNVICQTSALNVDEIVRRSQHAERVGADALMILPPYLEGPTDDDGIVAFYRDVDAAVTIDIVGYNIPQATGITVSPNLLAKLGELEHFNYIKDSAGDISVQQSFLRTDTHILNGCDPTTVFSLMAGATGAIWGAANYMPCEAVRLYELVKSSQYDEAFRLWEKMLPSLLHIWYGDYIPAVKAACRMRGFDGGGVRRPLQPLSPSDEEKLAQALVPLNS
ncbi:MAG: dihydrodipicolinate synthase family protein [Pseudomonadota bacterium]